jgi:hypothetical protein
MRKNTMSHSIRRTLQLTETQYFIIGVAAGLILFIVQLGLRSVVLFTGGTIVLMALIYWFWQTRSAAKAPSADLLELAVFVARLDGLKANIPGLQLGHWKVVQDQALAIWAIAAQLAQQESLLFLELIETLYSTLELAEQSAEALCLAPQQPFSKVQPFSRAQQQMQRSLEQLQMTQTQLQSLADQS